MNFDIIVKYAIILLLEYVKMSFMFFKTEIINNIPQDPYQYAGKLQTQIERSHFQGTGILIAENCVLTTAAYLYDFPSKKFANAVRFINKTNEEALKATAYSLPPSYIKDSEGCFDNFATILLEKKCPLPLDSHFKIKAMTAEELSSHGSVIIFAFPYSTIDGEDNRVACRMKGTIKQITADRLFYDVDKYLPGSGGSGVFVMNEKGEYTLVGIHAYTGGRDKNGEIVFPSGSRLTAERIALIKKWLVKYNIESPFFAENDELNNETIMNSPGTPS